MPVHVCLDACVRGYVCLCLCTLVCTCVRGKEIAKEGEREKEEGRVITLALVHSPVRRPFQPSFRPFFVLLFFFPPFSIDIFIYMHINTYICTRWTVKSDQTRFLPPSINRSGDPLLPRPPSMAVCQLTNLTLADCKEKRIIRNRSLRRITLSTRRERIANSAVTGETKVTRKVEGAFRFTH